jgi:hypothetical protein
MFPSRDQPDPASRLARNEISADATPALARWNESPCAAPGGARASHSLVGATENDGHRIDVIRCLGLVLGE